ncbi:MAG: DEAD/DEAH box helicase family protein, partial [Desulfobacterales bacterium]|nr:DEAD/DEAH box helicase family protein [Desulfobacterales bacterium]
MELKEYQLRALTEVKTYFELLAEWKQKSVLIPDAEIDFPTKAWEKAGIGRSYRPRKNGISQPLPNFCLKIPTGGGKTLLAVKIIDLVNLVYRKKRTGLVLWIVPTTQIYRQTILSLKDRDHPYRQHLDLASGGRSVILEKTDRFSPLDVKENLVVLMLMLPSANRQTKETLKVFKDSGGFQGFFPAEDDVQGQEKILQVIRNLDTYEKESGFWGKQVKTSLGNTLRTLSPVIILDEGHKAYSEGAQNTLRGFNPSIIIELSATPSKESNILVDISGRELHREEMIKLDLHVINKVSPDWKDTLLAGVNKRNNLEHKAREYEANSGVNIRPICLIQVERTGKEQRGTRFIHSEDVREQLIKTIGIPAEQVAVKTSEKDELKQVDDIGGLMSNDCRICYIITKQALQEGWDCAFAYVLVVLTNPASKNALTQLVGRILRQPGARKTKIRELDESYVFCFKQSANKLLASIKDGFSREGLGDLKGQILSESDETGGEREQPERIIRIRDRFRTAANSTLLPVFMVRHNKVWRPVNYEMDIAAKIPWDSIDLDPVYSLALSMSEEKDMEHIATLSDDIKKVIEERGAIQLKEGGIRVDLVFMTRQICDIVPNPWMAHELAQDVLARLKRKYDYKVVAANFVFIIEELRKQLEREKDRLSENIFKQILASDQMRFLVIGENFDFTFPKSIKVKPTVKTLNRKDGRQLQMSLFEFVPEDEFNETEKAVAWYLEGQQRLFFWYRNRSRQDYAIQGWRKHKIYPDFIFTATSPEDKNDYEHVYVVETKGLHLIGNLDTDYKRKMFSLCTKEAKSRSWSELGLVMKEKVLRFEVLAEDEWQAKLNEMLQA